MRNIFDQYSQPENKLTHALVCCLHEDRKLLKDFLQTFTNIDAKNIADLIIVEQTLPQSAIHTETEAEAAGLPDALIYPESLEWILVIENKISCGLTQDQLNRHFQTISRYDIQNIYGLTLTVQEYDLQDPKWEHAYWTDIFRWLRGHLAESKWAKVLTNYMEVLEMKLINDEYLTEGALTQFTGIPFTATNPYNYPEAKRVLKLLMKNLKQRTELRDLLNLDLDDLGRGAITSGPSVWDYVPVKTTTSDLHFTKLIHFSVSISGSETHCSMVIPDKLNSEQRKKIKKLSYDEFKQRIKTIAINTDKAFKDLDGYVPYLGLVQRRWYKGINSIPVNDAELHFDLRTAFDDLHGNDSLSIKTQEEWLKASYEAFCSKKSNIQIAIGVKFIHDRCSQIHTPEAANLCAQAWLACIRFFDET